MTTLAKPAMRPARPLFSSGPCAKRPGWSVEALQNAVVGRSHRSKLGKARLKLAIDKMRDTLGLPVDYLCGIVAGSDTGAVEMALWSLLGPRKIQVLAWESFSKDWVTDVVKQLKLPAETLTAGYGQLPDLTKVDPAADVVFAWNGTTSGVRVPNADFISADREGLTICDATSAVFAQDLDWKKLDVVTFSWQKVLGGEAAHGVLILSPRAIERLETYTPSWPMPKLFRMTKPGKDGEKNKVTLDIFEGATINTPSMLAVEDAIDALTWAELIGGLKGLQDRANANFNALARWVEKTAWVDFLAETPDIRSNTSVCLKVVDPQIAALAPEAQAEFAKKLASLLEKEGAALDAGAYRDAPAGLRIWCGSTIDASDVEALTPWLDWAFQTLAAEFAAAA